MLQMNVLDYLFLLQEHKNSLPLNTFTLIENKNQECLIPFIKQNIKRNISNSVIHSHKLTKGLLQKEYPYLVKDENLNLDNHITSYNLDGLLTEKEKNDLLKIVYNKKFNTKIPFWELILIYNFDKFGNTALIRRIPHLIADGEANAAAFNIFFDECTLPSVKLKNKKINWFNCKASNAKKILKYYSFFAMGFLLKTNDINNHIEKSTDIQQSQWINPRNTKKSYTKLEINYSDVEKKIKILGVSFTDFCAYVTSTGYVNYQFSKNKTINKKIYGSIPITYRKTKNKKPLYGTQAVFAIFDMNSEEQDNLIRLFKIKESIKKNFILIKKSPLIYYYKGLLNHPFKSKLNYSISMLNNLDWNNRRKIPSFNKEGFSHATSISLKKLTSSNFDYSINNNKILETNTFPTIVHSNTSIGFNTMFRVDKEKLILSVCSVDGIIEDSDLLSAMLEKAVYDLVN
jgi:hypothetical protein